MLEPYGPCSITPLLVLHPDSGVAGSIVAVDAYGFDASASIDMYWNGTSVGLAKADVRGTFAGSEAFKFAIPAGTSPGVYTVSGVEPLSTATAAATFMVY